LIVAFFDVRFPEEVPWDRIATEFFCRFKERERIEDLITKDLLHPVVISGERRIGKSSLLHLIQAAAEGHGMTAVKLTPSWSFEDYGQTLVGALSRSPAEPQPGVAELLKNGQATPADYVDGLKRLLRGFPGKRVVVLQDEFENFCDQCSPEDRDKVLQFVKTAAGDRALGFKFFFAVIRPTRMSRPSYPSKLLEWAEQIPLNPFDDDEAKIFADRVVAKRLLIPPKGHAALFRLAGGHPFFIKLLLKYAGEQFFRTDQVVELTPDRLQSVVKPALADYTAHLSIQNIVEERMTAAERQILREVSVHGTVANSALGDAALVAEELHGRGYLMRDGVGQWTLRIGCLQEFLESLPKLSNAKAGVPAVSKLRVESASVFRNDEKIHLDREELKIFSFLYQNRDRQFIGLNEIADNFYSGRAAPYGIQRVRTIQHLIARIQAKIEDKPGEPRHLIKEGLGYRLTDID
jgi:hypothetical protein